MNILKLGLYPYNRTSSIVIFFLSFVSTFSFVYFFSTSSHLPYADAISRLNIARKVVDNITPGLAQLGNVWLPLPQILMLPFIWNRFLWHTGIAGAIMSMSAFIIGGYYVYKSANLLTENQLTSFISTGIYALNINLLYLQTTAMSESLFLATLAATIYYFLEWTFETKKTSLIMAALAVSAMTLTRYEGLAVLLSSLPMVFVFTYLQKKKIHEAEGNTVIFVTLASLGFGLWTLYLTMIFKDPLFWKNYYATPAASGGIAAFSQAKPFLAALWQYFTSIVWMIGLIPTLYTILGLLILMLFCIWKKTINYLVLLMPISIFLFMVLTLQRNTPIVQPALTISNILSSDTSNQTGFNIRYGLLLLPWAAVMSSFVFRIKPIIIKVLFFSIFLLQVVTYIWPKYTLIYKIPDRLGPKPYGDFVQWMKDHYDGGKILVSAGSHEDQMFEMGFDYKTYIHEGTGKYWKESIDNPSRYATWVVLDSGHPQDQVAKLLTRADILDRDYQKVYDQEQLKVYKIITKPYFEIR